MKQLILFFFFFGALISCHAQTIVDPQTFTSDTTISDSDETYGRPSSTNKRFLMKYIRKYVRQGFSGDITVNAINGVVTLTDGVITNVKLASQTIDSSKIKNGVVSWIKLTQAVKDSITASRSGSPSGSAGGSLTGTYPNPTLAANTVGSTQVISKSLDSTDIKDYGLDLKQLSQSAAFADQIIYYDGNEWKPKQPGRAVVPDTIYLLGTGQSNMDGRDPTGDLSINSKVEKWNNTTNVWETATETDNTPIFQLAKLIQVENNCIVRYFKIAVGGTSIQQWLGTGTLISSINTELTSAGNPKISVVAWHQGESDSDGLGINASASGVTADNNYKAALDSVYRTFARKVWWTENTSFIVGGLYKGVGATLDDRDGALSSWAIDRANTGYANSIGLASFDALHFTGTAVDTLGERYFDEWKIKRTLLPLYRGEGGTGGGTITITTTIPATNTNVLTIPSSGSVTGTQDWNGLDEGSTISGTNYLSFTNTATTDSTFLAVVRASMIIGSLGSDSIKFSTYFTASGRIGIFLKGRNASGLGDGYMAQINRGVSGVEELRLYKVDAGTYTLLKDVNYTVNLSTRYDFIFCIRNDSMALLNGSGGLLTSNVISGGATKVGNIVLTSGWGEANYANCFIGDITYYKSNPDTVDSHEINTIAGTSTDLVRLNYVSGETAEVLIRQVSTDDMEDEAVTLAKVASKALDSTVVKNRSLNLLQLAVSGATNGQVAQFNSTSGNWEATTLATITAKRDTTIYVTDADYNFASAVTSANILARYNRVIIYSKLSVSASSDNQIFLHTPSADFLQCTIEIYSEDASADADETSADFTTNGAVDGTGGTISAQGITAGQTMYVRVINDGGYKWKLSRSS